MPASIMRPKIAKDLSSLKYSVEKIGFISLGSFSFEMSGPYGESQQGPFDLLELAKTKPVKIILIDANFTNRIELIDRRREAWQEDNYSLIFNKKHFKISLYGAL